MPRSEPTGEDYTPTPPEPHPEARQRVVPPAPAPPPEEDPPLFTTAVSTRLPGGRAEFVRRVTGVDNTQSGIQMFEGGYVYASDDGGGVMARPGELFLICNNPAQERQYINLYIYMPNNIWWPVPHREQRRSRGWHQAIRPTVRLWTALSAPERVRRACNTSIGQLRTYLQNTRLDSASVAQATDALNEFSAIRGAVENNGSSVTRAHLVDLFETWVAETCSATGADNDLVMNAVRDATYVEQPVKEDRLVTAITQLPPWLGDAPEDLSRSCNGDLQRLHRILDRVKDLANREQAVREWQSHIMLALNIGPRKANRIAKDRDLTNMLRMGDCFAAVDHLRSRHGIKDKSYEAMRDAITAAGPFPGSAAVPDEASNDNRLARKIRLREST